MKDEYVIKVYEYEDAESFAIGLKKYYAHGLLKFGSKCFGGYYIACREKKVETSK